MSYRQTSQIQDRLAMTISKGSGLQGPEGLAGAGGERIRVTRTQEKDSSSCKKRVVGGGGHGIELKTLEFSTENKHRTGNCEAGSEIRQGTSYKPGEPGGPRVLELSLGS